MVFVTRDRAQALAAALACLDHQTVKCGRIVVVDASEGRETEALCATRPPVPSVVYVRAERKSMTAQRNQALRYTADCAYTLFLDDDMELCDTAVETLLARWRDASPNVAALGALFHDARIDPDTDRRSRSAIVAALDRAYHRLFLLRRPGDGRMLRSGLPTHLSTRSTRGAQWVRVSSLAGGLLCVRTDLLRTVRFDDYFDGYVTGEDLDFTTRLSVHGELLCWTTPLGYHRCASSGRQDPKVDVRRRLVYRYLWFRKNRHVTRGNWVAFVWSWLGDALGQSVMRRWHGVRGVLAASAVIARLATGAPPPRDLGTPRLAWPEAHHGGGSDS